MQLNAEQYEKLIGALYESVLVPDAMNACMRDIAELLDARDSLLMIMNTASGRIEQEFYWTAPEDYGSYENHYYRIDPRIPRLEGRPTGEISLCQELLDAEFVRKDPFYNEYLIPSGVRYTMGGRLMRAGDRLAYYALHRAPDQPCFDEVDRRALAHIYPHLARSARLFLEFKVLRGNWHGSSAETLIDLVDRALVVSDACGHIHFANAMAESVFRQGTAFQVENGILQLVTSGNDHIQFERALKNAAVLGHGSEFVAGQEREQPMYIQVIPLPSDQTDPPNARVLLWLTPLQLDLHADPGLLRRVYGLSHKESKLACALAAGQTLNEYAEANNVTYGTVRSQIHAVFEKVGVSRQAELIARIAQLPRRGR